MPEGLTRLQGDAVDAGVRRELLEVLARAFLDNPMNRRIHRGSVAARMRANRAGLMTLVLDPAAAETTHVLCREGRVVAGWVANRLPAVRRASPGLSHRFAAWIHQGPRALFEWGRVQREVEGFRPAGPAIYLAVLGVEPAMWGMGFGTALISDVFEVARRESQSVYLESERPESIRFYRSRGFREIGRVPVFGIDVVGLSWSPTMGPGDGT